MATIPCRKIRNRGHAYEVWEGNGWRWEVLQKYQTPDGEAANPLARWFVDVYSPIVPNGEMGDTYVREIKQYAVLTKTHNDCPNCYKKR